MRWLRRLLGAQAAPVTEAPELEAWLRAGYDCASRGDPAGAERHLRAILEHDPAHADAHYYLGRIAASDHREEEAIALLQKAAELRPREAIYLEALGDVLMGAKRYDEAVEVLRAAVALLPDSTVLLNNCAAALIEANRREEARTDLEKLREGLPDAPEVHFNLGGIYREYGRPDESIASYRRALQLTPGHLPTYSNLLMQLNYSARLDAAEIFADHRRFGEQFARRYAPPALDAEWPRRLRIGYLSPDFHNHVVMRFMEPVLARHDRARFEIFCYHNHSTKDAVTDRLRALAERWRDCEELSDARIAERIRADCIDILVDLAGHTVGSGLLALAMKPAPVQMTYLGYPNTTGLAAVDYRISDAYADPPGESDRLSTERLLRLPGSYFCYRPEPDAPPVGPLPAQQAGHVTFGCFNNFAKLSDSFLAMAARVLAAVPNSRLLLKARPLSIDSVAQTVRSGFERAGIEPERVELRGWESGTKNHLSIYGSVDIALDSFPYNGATTTCEALWMGVPVISLVGDRHAGRVGSSLLNAVGFGEFVARDAGGYVATCARLAADVAKLAALRAGLRERMRRSPLMDEAGFTRGLEGCYLEVWERGRSAGVPAHAPRGQSDEDLFAMACKLREEKRLAEAEAACKDILRHRPGHLEALTLLWDLAFESGEPGAAIDWLLKAIAADGGVAAVHHMLGCALQAQEKIEDAIASFGRALELDPMHAKAHNNLGCIREAAGNVDEALRCYREAVRLDPKLAHAHYNLGNIFKQMGDATQAIAHIKQALAIEPGHAEWRCNLGVLQYGQLLLDEALENLEASIEIDPGYAPAYANLGAALVVTGRVQGAGTAFRKAQELKPNAGPEAWLLLLQHYRQGEDGQTLFEMHRSWADRHARRLTRATDHRPRAGRPGRRINIGYVSPDFVHHPAAYFIEPVLAAHDRDAFNVFCYASIGREDETTLRMRSMSGYWRNISMLSDTDAADRIRTDSIDILVDLAGHTDGGKLLLFARKPAPVQVTWLGYPNTTGLDTMDYRLSDAIADPPGLTERFHSEKLVRLPGGFLCYAPPKECPEVGEAPQYRNGGVTFGCFNNLPKVSPEMVALWAVLLRRLPGARLILKNYGLAAERARRELREQFLGHGIAGDRIDLRTPDTTLVEHFSKYGEVDIGLDVFPYNGTTTTCEAMWMGVPVVTLAGATHVSRVGASLLTNVGLPELVAETPEQYLDIAQRLAIDVERRRALRTGMRARLLTSRLLDASGFVRDLEAAYCEMLARA
jgi:predicted O-linked N-acetylglucosamine transferase (SPINDLY family)